MIKENFHKDIVVISTGGTFNKIYDPIKGDLFVDQNSTSLKKIFKKWKCNFKVINIIGKDSLNMNDFDRDFLCKTIKNLKEEKIIIIHGTDTVDKSAKEVASKIKNKKIVFVGAMVPFFVDETEASANFALSVGFLEANPKNGIYIAMHSIVREFDQIYKDKKLGVFLPKIS